MAREQNHQMRGGPVTVSYDPAATIARFSLAELAAGLSNGDVFYVEVITLGYLDQTYGGMAACYVPIQVGAGTYTLGDVWYFDLADASGNALGGGTLSGVWDSLTLDQSGGDLRVEVTKLSNNSTMVLICVATTFGP